MMNFSKVSYTSLCTSSYLHPSIQMQQNAHNFYDKDENNNETKGRINKGHV
jgi:hypothetical protein